MLSTVVDQKGVTHEFRNDGTGSGPCLDGFFRAYRFRQLQNEVDMNGRKHVNENELNAMLVPSKPPESLVMFQARSNTISASIDLLR